MTVRVKWGMAIGAFLGILLILGLIGWSRSRKPVEPVYQGRPLMEWVHCLYDGTNGPAGRDALRALGPRAAQYFFDSIDTDPGDTLMRQAYRSLRKRFPARLRDRAPIPPVPQPIRMQDITGLLGLIGPEAHETILAACAHQNRKVRYTAVQATPYLGRWSADAIPVVAGLLSDPDPGVRERAVEALARNPTDKTAALDALLEAIRSTRPRLPDLSLATAAKVLGEIGPDADEASPRLREFMLESSTVLRVESAIALWKIARDTNALGYLIAELKNPALAGGVLWELIPALGAMGPAAQPFVPALEAKLESTSATNSPAWLPTALHVALRRINTTNQPRPTVTSRPLDPRAPQR